MAAATTTLPVPPSASAMSAAGGISSSSAMPPPAAPAAASGSSTSHMMPPPNPAAGSSSLQRQASARSTRSSRSMRGSASAPGTVPSPRHGAAALPPPPSPTSSASGSRGTSLFGTPRLLSRRGSTRERTAHVQREESGAASKPVSRAVSLKGKGKVDERDRGAAGPAESPAMDVIETPQLRLERDPETGRKMINQYLVLHEIGYGTHGRVRLGRDMSAEVPTEDGHESSLSPTSHYYAIKIVDRNPKKKRLTGFSRQKGMRGAKTGGKMLENEIRKEIAIFKKVNHPNVVRMKEIIDDPESSKLFMVLEYCEGGEIRWKEDDGSPALTVAETRNIFRDTLLGLEYCIIHRDIKPSNLLRSGEHVKISDFGCSHYSEALRAAAATGDDDTYVDDIELAKTAGSPAFFAPEMCSSGDDTLSPKSPRSAASTPQQEVPALTLRPPSVATSDAAQHASPADDAPAQSIVPGLKSVDSTDAARASVAMGTRTQSSTVLPRRSSTRLPITNAIDVWALGVTLYCLLFGKTPFDAANEYLLMQVIPTTSYEVPPTMGRDRMSTGQDGRPADDEAIEALDLLKRLLEKDPSRRMTLEQAKHHPFTLHGLADPSAWLISTDPHAQTFVTVSNDEVAAVITKSSSFRERFRKGMKSISHKLQLLSGARNRSRSIGDGDGLRSRDTSRPPSAAPSESFGMLSPLGRSRRIASDNMPTPTSAQPASAAAGRRPAAFTPRDSPAASTVQLASPQASASVLPPIPVSEHPSLMQRHFIVRRPSAPSPATSSHAQLVSAGADDGAGATPDSAPRSPRQMPSASSLDKMRTDAAAATVSPSNSLRRRQSVDNEVLGRHRSSSTASSTANFGLGSLVRLLSRNSSQQSSRFGGRARTHRTGSDPDDGGALASPGAEVLRGDLVDDGGHVSSVRRSMDVSENGSSYSSRAAPSPERGWVSRIGLPMRRNSNLSQTVSDDYAPPHARGASYEDVVTSPTAGETPARAGTMPPTATATPRVLEEVDWEGDIGDLSDDDCDEDGGRPGAFALRPSQAQWHLSRTGLGLDVDAAPPPVAAALADKVVPPPAPTPIAIPATHLVSATPHLDTIPDASPSSGSPNRALHSLTPTHAVHAAAGGLELHRPLSRTSSRGSARSGHSAHSPVHHPHPIVVGAVAAHGGGGGGGGGGHSPTSASSGHGFPHSPYRSTFGQRARSPLGQRDDAQANLMRFASHPEDDEGDDDDAGIVLGGKRGRKGSVLSRPPAVGETA